MIKYVKVSKIKKHNSFDKSKRQTINEMYNSMVGETTYIKNL